MAFVKRKAVSDVPRKGNVDRNSAALSSSSRRVDVPRKGNVDRNIATDIALLLALSTFPARGTWIEM